jgi:Family of unknown function (DUF6188)
VTESPRPPYIRHSDGSVGEGHSVLPQSSLLARVGGLDMTFVRIDHQTRLQFGDFEIAIESPFRVTAPDGSQNSLDPGVRASLGPVLDLYPDALVTATVDADASLRLRFASGATLDVPAEYGFESWQVNGPGGFLVVCAPGGGGLAVWGGPDSGRPRPSTSAGVPDGATAEQFLRLKEALAAQDRARHLGRRPDDAIALFDQLSEDAKNDAPAFSEAVRSMSKALTDCLTPSTSVGPTLRLRYYRASLELSCFNAGHSIVGQD